MVGKRQKNKEILDTQMIVRVHRLFRNYKEIPLTHFPLLYRKHFNEIFDAMPWGYEWGVAELFEREFKGMIEIVNFVNEVPIYALRCKEDPVYKRIHKNKRILNKISELNWTALMKQLLDPELHLWTEFKDLLEISRSKIHIDLSPLEIVLLKDGEMTGKHIDRFHKILSRDPKGVRIDELYKLFMNLSESFALFGTPDVCSLTQEYFEIFHVREAEDSPVPIVFDGRTTTDPDLEVAAEDSQKISAKHLLDGLYQKTLILLSTTDGRGMKLGVWRSSIRSTFGDLDLLVQPLDLFKAWRDEGLVSIRTGAQFKNDLIIDLPSRKVNPKYTYATMEQLREMAEDCVC